MFLCDGHEVVYEGRIHKATGGFGRAAVLGRNLRVDLFELGGGDEGHAVYQRVKVANDLWHYELLSIP